jgi:lipopolysaccharide/colanic/teichoic acid biosynthesis glycosyltransferase
VAVIGAAGVSVLQLLTGDALLPRFVVFGSALLMVPLQVGVSALARRGRSRDEGRDRVVLVGAPSEGERLADDLRIAPERYAVLVQTFSPAEARGDGETSRPLVERVVEAQASVVVIDRLAQADDRVISQAAALHEAGIRVRTLLQFYEEWLGKLPLSELERASLFFDIGEVHRVRYGRARRLVDLALGGAGLLVLVAFTPIVLLGDLAANRGPLLYRQERVGKGGTRFQILKFRTMRPAAGGHMANEWTAVDDPRITPFGRFLRVSHLDELPQIVNILRGELSVVGPRPEQPQYVAELSEKLAFYDLRHLVRPGLTGWAQVKYGYAGDESDALEKLQYEFFYLRYQNLRFDLRVLGRTVRSVVGSQGRGR